MHRKERGRITFNRLTRSLLLTSALIIGFTTTTPALAIPNDLTLLTAPEAFDDIRKEDWFSGNVTDAH